MAEPSFFAKDPAKLKRAELIDIVQKVQGGLWLDIDDDGNEFWNLDKSVNAADYLEWVVQALGQYGLVPVQGPKEWRPRR